METLYENDLALPIDKGLLCLDSPAPDTAGESIRALLLLSGQRAADRI